MSHNCQTFEVIQVYVGIRKPSNNLALGIAFENHIDILQIEEL